MNLSGLQAECGRLLSDPNNQRWSLATLTTRINLAQTEIQGYTSAVKTSETLTPVANQRTLGLNANTMGIVRATKTLSDGTTIKPFNGITREELEFIDPNWQQWTAGEPMYWFYDATNQQVNLAPAPDSNNAIANGMTFWESRQPAALVNTTDLPFDSNNQMVPYHYTIVHWVVAHCFMDDGTPEALQKANYHYSGKMLAPGKYELQLGRIMAEFDVPEAVPEHILWQQQGGRVGVWNIPSKSVPLLWP